MHLRVSSLVLVLTFTAVLLAQDGGIKESETDFSDKKLPKTRALRLLLFKGEVIADPSNKAHAEAIDIAAMELTYPLAWQGRLLRPEKAEQSKVIKETVDAFETRLRNLSRHKVKSDVANLQRLYVKQAVIRARDVILAGPPIASVNAARILALIPYRQPGDSTKDWAEEVLPRLQGDTAEELLSTCADLIAADPKKVNDGVRIFLLRTAHDVLALPKQSPPLYKQATADKAVLAAMGVVTRKVVFPKATPRGEVEGFKMLRAEALRVVARASAPTIGTARPALLLAQVAGNDESVNPPPRVEEQLEAAIGLSRVTANATKVADFNADYAAQQVARAVTQIGVVHDANKEAGPMARLRPWRVDGGRLVEAVDLMAGIKDPYVAEVVRRTREVGLGMEAGRGSGAEGLGTWVAGDAKPASTSLFKGGEPSTIKPRGGTDE
jgi:hypothetical protein